MRSDSFSVLLGTKNSKKVAVQVIDAIKKDPQRMAELMECFFDEDLRMCQSAAWPVGMIADHDPDLITPYIKRMLDNLETPHHDAVIRNTFRALQNIEIPEDIEGLAFDKALEFLADPQNAIAIRVFAMTVCGNMAHKYPELKHELIPIIEEQLPYGSAGYLSRGNRVLKLLKG